MFIEQQQWISLWLIKLIKLIAKGSRKTKMEDKKKCRSKNAQSDSVLNIIKAFIEVKNGKHFSGAWFVFNSPLERLFSSHKVLLQ